MQIYDDVWIPTQCGRCYAQCGIKVRRVNEIAVKIEGMTESDMGPKGGLCSKGQSALQLLYDPNRLNVPLMRTNPEKGMFVDPKWKEITWDEALNEIGERLQKILKDNPKKILWQQSVVRPFYPAAALRPWFELGVRNLWVGGGGLHCGSGAHLAAGLVNSSWSVVPDFRLCNYIIFFGANKGTGSGHSSGFSHRMAAEGRARGAKFVVFDPMCNQAGGKATEWVPIIPGTDGAIALAMCNVIVNELGKWDELYLKTKSNGVYLIGPDGRYVRDKETKKPLVWDAGEGKVKVHDDSSVKDFALFGQYEVDGIKCQPGFALIKEHLKQYTCEFASEVSTVPAETIRRIACEFTEAASIGSTIKIDGHVLPLRPASAVLFRGGEGHENSFMTCFAVSLLDQIVGSADVPGGTLGWPAKSLGYPETGKFAFGPFAGKDGILETDFFGPGLLHREGPWPLKDPKETQNPQLKDIFPLGLDPGIFGASDREEIWQKIGLPYRFEMMISWGCNSIMSVANHETMEDSLKKIPFIVVVELFATELANGFADILLPDHCFLEQFTWSEGRGMNFNYPYGMADWCYHITQPVVNPKGNHQRRSYMEMLWELVDRLGYRKDLNASLNQLIGFDEEHKIKPDERLSMEEFSDRMLKWYFGEEHGLDYFKKHGFIRWPKRVEEAYWRYFVNCRVPVYLEFMVDIKEKMMPITKKLGLDIDYTQYSPLINWAPCSIHKETDPNFDLYCFSYRDTLHTGSCTMETPWINELSHMNPYTYNITVNRDTAQKRGLKDGDIIEIETKVGRRVTGTLKTMEGQHPLTVGIAACSGHWSPGLPIAKGKGANFDKLLELDLKHVDPISLNIETAVRVKVKKVERS
jgi:anaerobic selenocysteine-containing dehydrogenase